MIIGLKLTMYCYKWSWQLQNYPLTEFQKSVPLQLTSGHTRSSRGRVVEANTSRPPSPPAGALYNHRRYNFSLQCFSLGQQIYITRFLTICQPIQDIFRYLKKGYDALKNVSHRKIMFSKTLLCVRQPDRRGVPLMQKKLSVRTINNNTLKFYK